jgi:hypothetical protein
MPLKRRIDRLKKKAVQGVPEMPTCIVMCSVAPGPDGPVNMGMYGREGV